MATKWRVGLFVDREDWILGTIAKEIKKLHSESGEFEFFLGSQEKMLANPIGTLRHLQRCHVVHWLSAYGYEHFGQLVASPQICTLNHVLKTDKRYIKYYNNVDIILTISLKSKAALEERGFDVAKVIHTGTDPDIFLKKDKTQCRQQLGVSDISKYIVGFFGKGSSNAEERKDTKTLIDALTIVNQNIPVGLLLSGDGWDSLILELNKRNIPVARKRVDTLEEMATLYNALDMYVCTSRLEGGPVPVLEAMACECPVISTPVGHVPELIEDKSNGVLIPYSDPTAVAAAIQSLIEAPEYSAQIAKRARETVLANWTWEQSLQPLRAIYLNSIQFPKRAFQINRAAKQLSMLILRAIKYRLR